MIRRSAHFRKPLALSLLVISAIHAFADPAAEEILASARVNPMGKKTALEARLRSGSDSTPFEIRVDAAVSYFFQNPKQELTLTLADDGPILTERIGDSTSSIQNARFDDPVRNSGITYEDLALRFLYWKNPRLLGGETLRTRKAWKIETQAGSHPSQYGVARVWIDQKTGAILRMEGYDREGRLRRRFEVISAQKIDGQWMLKQMRVETFAPRTGKILNRTYLEILGQAE